MNKHVDWHAVIVKIKKERNWPMKVIADKVCASPNTLKDWKAGKCEPRYSQGAELLRLAGND